MGDLVWILAGGLLMSVVAMIGFVTIFITDHTVGKLILPMLALAAGTLLGGGFFHMLPASLTALSPLSASAWLVAGFTAFLCIEQFLHWHHSHQSEEDRREPVTYLVLIGDGLHNFIGGLTIAGTFLVSPHAGVMAWIAAVAHEIPQELGDFGVLLHGGWPRKQAIIWNFLSALTFPLGGITAWYVATAVDLSALAAFGAGNFIYIAASDLIPEIKHHRSLRASSRHFILFVLGLGIVFLLALLKH